MDRHERRWSVVALLGVAVPLLLVVVALGLRFHGSGQLARSESRFIEEVGLLDPRAYAPPPVSGAENAATVLVAGAEALILSSKDQLVIGKLLNTRHDRWSEEERGAARGLIARSGAALALLHRAQDLPKSNYGISRDDGLEVSLPPLSALSLSARLLDLQGRLALTEGRGEQMLRCYETLGRLAASLEQERILQPLRIGVDAERRQLALARELLGAGAPDTLVLDRLEAGLSSVDLIDAYRADMASSAAQVLPYLSGENGSSEMPLPRRMWSAVMGPLSGARVLDIYRRQTSVLDLPYPEARAALEQAKRGGDITLVEKLIGDDPGLAGGIAFRGASLRRLAAVAFRLGRHAVTTGAYPIDLAGDPQATLPDPLTGRPLALEPLDGGGVRLGVPGALEELTRLGEPQRARLYAWRLAAPD